MANYVSANCTAEEQEVFFRGLLAAQKSMLVAVGLRDDQLTAKHLRRAAEQLAPVIALVQRKFLSNDRVSILYDYLNAEVMMNINPSALIEARTDPKTSEMRARAIDLSARWKMIRPESGTQIPQPVSQKRRSVWQSLLRLLHMQ